VIQRTESRIDIKLNQLRRAASRRDPREMWHNLRIVSHWALSTICSAKKGTLTEPRKRTSSFTLGRDDERPLAWLSGYLVTERATCLNRQG
jgi:hypothetical protein